MKLHVHVLEARDLGARDQNGLSDPFVRLQLGNTKTKSAVIHRTLNPAWHEEFFFNVVGSDEELLVTIWDEDRFSNDFLGQVKIPISLILTAEKQIITRQWYTLQKRSERSKFPITGEILLSLSLFGKDVSTGPRLQRWIHEEKPSVSLSSIADDAISMLSPTSSMDMSDCSTDVSSLVDVPGSPSVRGSWPGSNYSAHDEDFAKEQNKAHKTLADRLTAVFNKKGRGGVDGASKHSGEGSSTSTPKFSDSVFVDNADRFPEGTDEGSDDETDMLVTSYFDDDGKSTEASVDDFPAPLTGGLVLDQRYAVSAKSMSALILKASSPFIQELLAVQKTTEYVEEPWKSGKDGIIERGVTYMKAATKMIKAVKATETQTCRKIGEKGFVFNVSCSTPDVPYGGNFLVELQFCILAGQDLPSKEKSCRLQVSWRLNFLHSTMMKGMIENGARAGIKETYQIYKEVLAKYAKPISEDSQGEALVPGVKEEETPLSDWELVRGYFGKLHVLLASLSLTIVLLHICFAPPKLRATLIRWGFDLPDTISELLFSAIVVLQVEKVVKMVQQFLQARYWQSGDHGVKAQGDGWLMTVTLIEGENLSPTEESSFANPYVVFTCSGKRRTSSVKLRTLNPRWREIFEFDATEDPPSTMDVEVFDYDGPFSDAESLGHAEINFLKQGPNDLADFWVPLSGKTARTHGSRLHLRVFLTNTKQTDALPKYLEQVQKEVGTKVVKRSAQKNGSFQKLFALPAEEFLINDFACAIKKKILIQGRVFLSPRMLGFYSNLFGMKTKFQFIWEDIDEIVETPVAINPYIIIFLRKGRGLDARNGMRGIDAHGRMKFHFCSFVKPVTAFRTITLLWKNRKLSPEQQLEIVEDSRDPESQRTVDDCIDSFTGMEEAKMTHVCSFDIPLTTDCVMTLFEKGGLEEVVAEKMGYVNYVSTPWERLDSHHGPQNNVLRRQISYHLNRQISQFGSKVSCIQQKTISENMKSCVVDEVLTLHDVPFGDHFQVQVRRDIETTSVNPPKSFVKASVGVSWHKNTEFKRKITKNVHDHMAKEIREVMNICVREIKAHVKDKKISANGSNHG
ncbi:hypothetical protein M758_1G231500 [Ceratodon purpureus]|nr:hypothetical protein M758_1G231500 [Ceratodon purpureus]